VNAAVEAYKLPPEPARSRGVWATAWRRLKNDRVGVVSLAVVAVFVAMILLSGVGLLASDWQKEVAVPDAPPTFVGPRAKQTGTDPLANVVARDAKPVDLTDIDPLAPKYAEWKERAAKIQVSEPPRVETLPFGADRLGRSVLDKTIKGAEISIFVGLFAAVLATIIGTILGALSGYVGGKVGDFLEWVYNVFTSIPDILLIFAFAAVLGRGIGTVILILGLVGWTGMYRLVRAEYIKHRTREYVRAAEAIGTHVVLVRMSLYVVGFIKAEVILSFLGLGVPVDQVSWGTMLSEAQAELVLGHWWQLAAATLFMATFVTAFSLFTDALRDALDPKLR
jgi:oligopeptide transport system permease protein